MFGKASEWNSRSKSILTENKKLFVKNNIYIHTYIYLTFFTSGYFRTIKSRWNLTIVSKKFLDVEKKNQQKSFQLLFDVMEFFSSPEINYSNHSIKISANFSLKTRKYSRKSSVVDFADNLSKCDSQKKKSEKLVEMYLVLVKNCMSGSE